jgi:molecular chaperone GrpE
MSVKSEGPITAAQIDKKGGGKPAKETKKASAPHEKLESQVLELNKKVQDLESAYNKSQETLKKSQETLLRQVAEMQNLEKLAHREARMVKERANQELLKALIPILDSLDYGLQSYEKDQSNIAALKEGLTLTHNMMAQVLKEHDVVVLDPVGQPFNPQCHEALTSMKDPNAKPKTILQVMQKGYMLKGQLVRAAKVIVNQ